MEDILKCVVVNESTFSHLSNLPDSYYKISLLSHFNDINNNIFNDINSEYNSTYFLLYNMHHIATTLHQLAPLDKYQATIMAIHLLLIKQSN